MAESGGHTEFNGRIEFSIKFQGLPSLDRALRDAAPKHLVREVGKAFFRIGRSDIDKLQKEQLSGGPNRLAVSFKGLRNAFKFKAADSRKIASLNDLWLHEYTGWKMFRIFQTGGTIVPRKAKMLTVLSAAGRPPGRKRKYTQKQLKAAIQSGEFQIVRGAKMFMIVRVIGGKTKSGRPRKGSRTEVIAYLVPSVTVKKRLDFFGNFDANKAEHDRLLNLAGEMAIQKTMEDAAQKRGTRRTSSAPRADALSGRGAPLCACTIGKHRVGWGHGKEACSIQ